MHMDDRLSAYVDEELDDTARLEVEAHLRDCSSCRALADELRELRGLVAGAYRDVELPDASFEREVLMAVQRDTRTRAPLPVLIALCAAVLLFGGMLIWLLPLGLLRLMTRVAYAIVYAVSGTLLSEPLWAWGVAGVALLLIVASGVSLRRLLGSRWT